MVLPERVKARHLAPSASDSGQHIWLHLVKTALDWAISASAIWATSRSPNKGGISSWSAKK